MNDTFKNSIEQVWNDYPVTLMICYVLLFLIAYPFLKKKWPVNNPSAQFQNVRDKSVKEQENERSN